MKEEHIYIQKQEIEGLGYLYKNISGNIPIKLISDNDIIRSIEKKTGKTGIMYKNKYIIVVNDPVQFPNGKYGTYIRIVGSNQKSYVGGSVLLIVNAENEILLQKQYRYNTNYWSWECPRGFMESNEEVLEGAKRELKEECNIDANELNINISPLGYIQPNNGILSEEDMIYLVRVDSKKLQNIHNNDVKESISQHEWFSLEKITEMVKNNEIRDGFTLAAIYKYIC